MKIFTLNKTYQDYDHEHWQHWGSSSIVNYFLTEELANSNMNSLIEQEEYESDIVWDAKLGDARNIINIAYGSSPHTYKDHNLYFIESIDVIE